MWPARGMDRKGEAGSSGWGGRLPLVIGKWVPWDVFERNVGI